jgi:hypothetical protein
METSPSCDGGKNAPRAKGEGEEEVEVERDGGDEVSNWDGEKQVSEMFESD